MIRNIFLDAGGVILDETQFENKSAEIITGIIKQYNKEYLLENYWKDAEEAVYRFVPKVYDYVLYKNIADIENFRVAKTEYKNKMKSHNTLELADGITEFLADFSKCYKIGILGQYGIDLINFLESKNVLRYFAYKEIQDDYKITKPDTRYFEAVLRKCNCKAEESIMIGDRIDKDVIPAKLVGMKTIRIKTGIHKNQEPRTPEEMADLTVTRLCEIKAVNYLA
ncbi:MAG: HAD family hydrolase [Treponema sp.]|jgi:HAD superfamily hydrolase (TIGR01549 family)|nr:HAD family hydrolase [Treponema sp.]